MLRGNVFLTRHGNIPFENLITHNFYCIFGEGEKKKGTRFVAMIHIAR